MTRTAIAALMVGGVLTFTLFAQESASRKSTAGDATLGAAIHQAEGEGNLDAAIAAYKKVLADYKGDRPLAARAQYHLALAYEKVNKPEARRTYEQLVQQYADQPQVAADARRRLALLDVARPVHETLTERHVFTTLPFESPTSITPDGRLMGIDGGRIGVRDVASSRIQWLVDGPAENVEAECTIISPDQRQVAYAWYAGGAVDGDLRLIANEPGSRPRVLIPARQEFGWVDPIAWSPDGRSILIVIARRDQTMQVGWVRVSDGAITVLRSLDWRLRGAPTLSLDGRYIAYSAMPANPMSAPAGRVGEWTDPMRAPGEHIYVLAADGSVETDVTRIDAINAYPVWTPDGAHLLFISDRYGSLDLWSTPVQAGKAAGAASIVKRGIGSIQPIGVTRSGTFYYNRPLGEEQLTIAEIQRGRNMQTPPIGSETVAGAAPSWSPDGTMIAFQRKRAAAGADGSTVAVVRSIETGEERVYPHPGIMPAPARWLSDSKAFLVATEGENGAHALYRVDVKTGEFNLVHTFVSSSPDYVATTALLAPDDRTLYIVNADLHGLVALDLTTGQQRPFFTVPENRGIRALALADDGRTIALEAQDKTAAIVARVEVDGTGYRELHRAARGQATRGGVAWATDRGGILFFLSGVDSATWKLMRISADGGEPGFTGLEQSAEVGWLRLNHDGTRLAFSSRNRGVSEVWAIDNLMPQLKASR